MTGFGEKSVKNAPNMAFFGALRANRSTFCLFTAKVLKTKWVLKFLWLLLLPVRWVLAWKIVEFLGGQYLTKTAFFLPKWYTKTERESGEF